MGALAIYATLRDAVEIASDFEIVNEQAWLIIIRVVQERGQA